MSKWADVSNDIRGRLVRFYISDINKAPVSSAGELKKDNENIKHLNLGVDFAAKEHPSIDNVKAFRKNLIEKYRDYLDGLGFSFKNAISDNDIGILAGVAADLSNVGGEAFFESVGSSGSLLNESRETGLDKVGYERGLTQKAIINPDSYIVEMNKDLKSIELKSLTVFRESFRKYYDDYKYSAEEAKARAMEDRKVYYDMLLKQHNAIYKVDTYNAAKKRISVNPK